MKVVVLDSGVLINLSMNGLLYILEDLGRYAKFVITHAVENEIIKRPLEIPRFELGAMRLRDLVTKKIVIFPEDLGIDLKKLKKRTDEFLAKSNSTVRADGEKIKIVSEGEISCLALSSILSEKGIENLIGIDERTMRILCEKPENLKKIISKRIHRRVEIDRKNIVCLKGFRFIRSTELVFVAYKKGLLRVKGKRALEAVLYATKYKGASVSFEEIKELKKLA